MAAGEYVSMRSQREMFEYQIGLERDELAAYPEEEAHELALIYEARGISPEESQRMAQTVITDPASAETIKYAANAFLKLLEEPPPGTSIILTSCEPGALLPTIRSRVVTMRMGPPPAQPHLIESRAHASSIGRPGPPFQLSRAIDVQLNRTTGAKRQT